MSGESNAGSVLVAVALLLLLMAGAIAGTWAITRHSLATTNAPRTSASEVAPTVIETAEGVNLTSSSPVGAAARVVVIDGTLDPSLLEMCAARGDGLIIGTDNYDPTGIAACFYDSQVAALLLGQWSKGRGSMSVRLVRNGTTTLSLDNQCLTMGLGPIPADRFYEAVPTRDALVVHWARSEQAAPLERVDGVALARVGRAPLVIASALMTPNHSLVGAVTEGNDYSIILANAEQGTSLVVSPDGYITTLSYELLAVAPLHSARELVGVGLSKDGTYGLVVSTGHGRWPLRISRTALMTASPALDPRSLFLTVVAPAEVRIAGVDRRLMPRSIVVATRTCSEQDVVLGCVPPATVVETCVPNPVSLATSCIRVHAPLPMAAVLVTHDLGFSFDQPPTPLSDKASRVIATALTEPRAVIEEEGIVALAPGTWAINTSTIVGAGIDQKCTSFATHNWTIVSLCP